MFFYLIQIMYSKRVNWRLSSKVYHFGRNWGRFKEIFINKISKNVKSTLQLLLHDLAPNKSGRIRKKFLPNCLACLNKFLLVILLWLEFRLDEAVRFQVGKSKTMVEDHSENRLAELDFRKDNANQLGQA